MVGRFLFLIFFFGRVLFYFILFYFLMDTFLNLVGRRTAEPFFRPLSNFIRPSIYGEEFEWTPLEFSTDLDRRPFLNSPPPTNKKKRTGPVPLPSFSTEFYLASLVRRSRRRFARSWIKIWKSKKEKGFLSSFGTFPRYHEIKSGRNPFYRVFLPSFVHSQFHKSEGTRLPSFSAEFRCVSVAPRAFFLAINFDRTLLLKRFVVRSTLPSFSTEFLPQHTHTHTHGLG